MHLMRRTLSLVPFFALASLALAAEKASVRDLLTNGKKFDGKVVTVTGSVDAFQARTSKAGNPYFVFKLKEKDQTINVYGRGKLDKDLKSGAKVEITGKYAVEKKVGKLTFKNEVDVTDREKPGANIRAK